MLTPYTGGRRESWTCSRRWMMRGRCFRPRRVRSAVPPPTCASVTPDNAPNLPNLAATDGPRMPSSRLRRREPRLLFVHTRHTG